MAIGNSDQCAFEWNCGLKTKEIELKNELFVINSKYETKDLAASTSSDLRFNLYKN